MKIAFITAGAAGMYCGSCMKDNTLAAELIHQGHDALLIPTYTPIRTDEDSVAQGPIYFGGVNVYLQQQSRLFRWLPGIVDRLFNFAALLRLVSPLAQRTDPKSLGPLARSMLQGPAGRQRKELRKLVDHLRNDVKPDVILLTNLLLSGMVPTLQAELGVPIYGTLQGDDIFLDALTPADRAECIALIRQNATSLTGTIVTSQAYADLMADYLGIDRIRMHVVPPGLNLRNYGAERVVKTEPPYVIGYFARICEEKGFGRFVDAILEYRARPDAFDVKFRAAGWLGANHRAFYESQIARLADANVFEYVDCPGHKAKVEFLRSLDLFSVPTQYHEPKGLYVLEALANRVPVVQPAHGSFPELLANTGGTLVPAHDAAALAEAWHQLLADPARRATLADQGKETVFTRFDAASMARRTLAVLEGNA